MENAFRVRLPPATGSGAALCRGLRASSRRYHRPTGQIQQPGRTQDWIKLGGEVRIQAEENDERAQQLSEFEIPVARADHRLGMQQAIPERLCGRVARAAA